MKAIQVVVVSEGHRVSYSSVATVQALDAAVHGSRCGVHCSRLAVLAFAAALGLGLFLDAGRCVVWQKEHLSVVGLLQSVLRWVVRLSTLITQRRKHLEHTDQGVRQDEGEM